jgi:hypothetical protein
MRHPHCVLCDRPAADDYFTVELPLEIQVLLARPQGGDPGEFLRENVVCNRCASAPTPGQQERLVQAIRREVALFILTRHRVTRPRRTMAH